jgi:protein-disulfide isomerase
VNTTYNKKLLLLPFLFLLNQCKADPADSLPPSTDPPTAPAGTQQQQQAPAAAPAVVGKPKLAKDDTASAAVKVPVDGLPAFGSPKALVTVVAFTDYQCPYCYKADDRIAQLRQEYGPEKVRFVVGSHPLPMHDRASPAARAFLAAVEQGKGEAMHLRLFARQEELDEAGLQAAARDVGLDLAQFDRARTGASTEAALKKAEEIGNALGVEGTPTFFVNGRRLVGARPIEAFRSLIDEEMTKAQAIVDRGTPPDRLYAAIMKDAPDAPPVKAKDGDPLDSTIFDVPVLDSPLRGGGVSTPVTIVLFSDFECPFCVKAEKTLREIESNNKGKVRVAFKHRPLPMHSHARLAAKASLAAERQGKFWEYHDLLLQHRDALERTDLDKYALEVGLNPTRFARDIDDPALEARIAADEKEAERLDVKGTPTAFVNGRRITGAQPMGTWQTAVDRAQAARK